ncbi:DMT family transporter [Brevibacillus daliensis]|uniref:DMT family transporter n=1 Tax=Brevibacillus daliensis TaxID=2892995 RepID=UPI001E40A3A0|nr:DMT family transporter [Brevibacillus daliensis]
MKIKEQHIYIILAAVIVIWGLNTVMIKYLSFFPPAIIAAIRMTVAALTLTPIIFAYRNKYHITKKQWGYVAGIGATSIALHQIFIAWGMQMTTAGNASLILALNPLVTAILAAIFLRESIHLRKIIGVILGFSGVLLVVGGSTHTDMNSNIGDVIIFISMIMYVVGGLLIRKATSSGVPVLLLTACSQWIGALFLIFTSFIIYPMDTIVQSFHIDGFTWFVIGISGMLATGLGTLGWNMGIQRIGASRTSIFLNGMPIAGMFFATLLLDEPLTIVVAVALLLTVAGVYLGSTTPKLVKRTSTLKQTEI